MAVLKLSGNKGQLQFIDKDGLVYGVSVKLVNSLCSDKGLHTGEDFIVLARLPFTCSVDRYPRSKLWNGTLLIDDVSPPVGHVVSVHKDGFAAKKRLAPEVDASYGDVVI